MTILFQNLATSSFIALNTGESEMNKASRKTLEMQGNHWSLSAGFLINEEKSTDQNQSFYMGNVVYQQ